MQIREGFEAHVHGEQDSELHSSLHSQSSRLNQQVIKANTKCPAKAWVPTWQSQCMQQNLRDENSGSKALCVGLER